MKTINLEIKLCLHYIVNENINKFLKKQEDLELSENKKRSTPNRFTPLFIKPC